MWTKVLASLIRRRILWSVYSRAEKTYSPENSHQIPRCGAGQPGGSLAELFGPFEDAQRMELDFIPREPVQASAKRFEDLIEAGVLEAILLVQDPEHGHGSNAVRRRE